MSSAEIEDLRIAAKRHQVKDLMKQNEKRGRQAILCPQTNVARRSLSLTVPKEFNLSCPATPSRSCNASDAGDSEYECEEARPWSRSLRGQGSVPPSPAKAWEPELTVPHGPELRTEHRSRSSSLLRAAGGTPGGKRSMSRHRMPREQEAIERHLERTYAAQAPDENASELSVQSNKPSWNDSIQSGKVAPRSRMEPLVPAEAGQAGDSNAPKKQSTDMGEEWVRAGATPEERAKRAREAAQQKFNEKAEKAAQLKCFTGAKMQRQGRGGHPGTTQAALRSEKKE